MRVAPDQPAGQSLGIRIEQKLMGIEAVSVLGLVGTVNTVAIELAGRDVIEVTVPDIFGALG